MWKEGEVICNLIESKTKYDVQLAENHLSQQHLWKIRENISPAIRQYDQVMKADIVVPRNKMSICIELTKQLIDNNLCRFYCFGHAGDGNLHFNFVNPAQNDPSWYDQMNPILHKIYEKVIELGGAISGEHGIGILQKKYFKANTNHKNWQILTYIKDSLDPNGIFNPGKII